MSSLVDYEGQIAQRLADLKLAQDTLDPNLPGHVREIHLMLKENPEIVSILSDDQIAVYLSARRGMAAVTIAPAKKATASKRAAKVSMDDIG